MLNVQNKNGIFGLYNLDSIYETPSVVTFLSKLLYQFLLMINLLKW